MIRHTRDNETNIIEIETMDIEKGRKEKWRYIYIQGDMGYRTWDMGYGQRE